MKKSVVIATAVLLALLTAAGILLTTSKKDSTSDAESSRPNVRIIGDSADNTNTAADNSSIKDETILSQNAQIAELRAQLDDLERKMAQQEFDYTALKAEKDKLEKRSETLEKQNQFLRSRNNTLSDEGQRLQGEIAQLNEKLEQEKGQAEFDRTVLQAEQEKLQEQLSALEEQNQHLNSQNSALSDEEQKLQGDISALNERLAQLEKDREENEAAYQAALTKIEEYEVQAAITQAALEEANTPGTRVTEDGNVVSTFGVSPTGQSRNIVGIKIGGSDIDIEGTFALMPHWFLIADVGAVEVPKDFVEDEFPGLTADHAFVYTALFGTGLNWRFNSIQSQPNIYIATMAGPAWYLYKEDGKIEINTYLLWRSSIGFDMTLYKNLQFTTDLSFDWMKDYGFTPHLTVGLQWSFSNSWALFGGNK